MKILMTGGTGFINEPGTALMAVVIEHAIHMTRFQDLSAWIKQA